MSEVGCFMAFFLNISRVFILKRYGFGLKKSAFKRTFRKKQE